MLKWLLVIGVVAAVYYLFIKKSAPLPKSGKSSSQDAADEDTLVPCETCGTYVSVHEAYLKDGRYYCSIECMKKA